MSRPELYLSFGLKGHVLDEKCFADGTLHIIGSKSLPSVKTSDESRHRYAIKMICVAGFQPANDRSCMMLLVYTGLGNTLWQWSILANCRRLHVLWSASLGGDAALRATLLNPWITAEHLDQLLETLRRHGHMILAGQ